MKLITFGSHNSWTFRKPIKWYLKPLCFIAKCQDVDIQTQMKDQIIQEQQFITFCNELTRKYPNIKFFGGNRKFDNKVVYNFNTVQQPTLIDLYSSVTTLFDSDNKYLRILDDWFPRLYALLKNKKNLKEYVDTDDTYLFYDFVNIN